MANIKTPKIVSAAAAAAQTGAENAGTPPTTAENAAQAGAEVNNTAAVQAGAEVNTTAAAATVTVKATKAPKAPKAPKAEKVATPKAPKVPKTEGEVVTLKVRPKAKDLMLKRARVTFGQSFINLCIAGVHRDVEKMYRFGTALGMGTRDELAAKPLDEFRKELTAKIVATKDLPTSAAY